MQASISGSESLAVRTITNIDRMFSSCFVDSCHVETVVCLSNKNAKPKDYVEIGVDAEDVDAEDYYRIKNSEKSE